MNPNQAKLAFIGVGNMALSLIGGMIGAGWRAEQIRAADPLVAQHQKVAPFGVHCDTHNTDAVAGADAVIFAVKPNIFPAAAQSVAQAINQMQTPPLLISIVAGVQIADALQILGEHAFIRAMPNTPALINRGVSGLFANARASDQQKQLAEQIMSAAGEVVWLEREELIDAVTGVSGCGPAYFFKLMELLAERAEAHGLDPAQAKKLVLKTALGAALLADSDSASPAELRRRVTSPNGATEAALRQMRAMNLDDCIKSGVDAAVARSREIGCDLSARGGKT